MTVTPEPESTGWQLWSPREGDFHELRIERSGPVLRVTLDNPQKLNAVTRQMLRELLGLRLVVESDPEVSVMILTGAGRGFCSGADIGDLIGHREAAGVRAEIPEAAGRFFPILDDFPVPVIAAVNGPAAGDGMSLAVMADLRVASDDAFFVESHVQRGLTPSVLAWYLPRIVGLGRAYEMVVLGRRVSAGTALEWGLVNEVVPREDLLDRADAIAREILALDRFAMLTARGALLRTTQGHGVESVREWAGSMEALALALRGRGEQDGPDR
jgi:enoyl-CoA hydratase/carnithine racemase